MKDLTQAELLRLTHKIQSVCDAHGIPLDRLALLLTPKERAEYDKDVTDLARYSSADSALPLPQWQAPPLNRKYMNHLELRSK